MKPALREKHVKSYAKMLAKAEWRKFKPEAEAAIQAMMIDPNTAPLLEGKVRSRVRNRVETSA